MGRRYITDTMTMGPGTRRFNTIFNRDQIPGNEARQSAVGSYEEERNFINEALEAGLDGGQGEELGREAARYIGREYGVPLSSGTAALHLALRLAGERLYGSASGICTPEGPGRGGALYGKRVFCPDFAALESVVPVVYEGGEPVFIDCGETDWSMDPEALELAFRKYPEAGIVIMNHAYGCPGQVIEIRRICQEHGALLIEDCAESLGAEVQTGPERNGTGNGRQESGPAEILWRKAGCFGDYAVLDFGPGRILTGGAGGMLLTDDRYSAEKAFYWAGGARTAAPWDQHEELGCSYRIGDLAAAAVRGQLRHLDEIIEKKRAVYERYADKLEGDLAAVMPIGEGTRPNYWRSCMTVESSIGFRETRGERDYTYAGQHGTAAPMEILEALAAFYGDAGCGLGRGSWRVNTPWSSDTPRRGNIPWKYGPLYKPLSLQPLFRNCEAFTLDGSRWSYRHFYEEDYRLRCHRAKEYFESGLCLPCDAGMLKEEQDKVLEVILHCYSKADM